MSLKSGRVSEVYWKCYEEYDFPLVVRRKLCLAQFTRYSHIFMQNINFSIPLPFSAMDDLDSPSPKTSIPHLVWDLESMGCYLMKFDNFLPSPFNRIPAMWTHPKLLISWATMQFSPPIIDLYIWYLQPVRQLEIVLNGLFFQDNLGTPTSESLNQSGF